MFHHFLFISSCKPLIPSSLFLYFLCLFTSRPISHFEMINYQGTNEEDTLKAIYRGETGGRLPPVWKSKMHKNALTHLTCCWCRLLFNFINRNGEMIDLEDGIDNLCFQWREGSCFRGNVIEGACLSDCLHDCLIICMRGGWKFCRLTEKEQYRSKTRHTCNS